MNLKTNLDFIRDQIIAQDYFIGMVKKKTNEPSLFSAVD